MPWQTQIDRLRSELFVGRVDERQAFDALCSDAPTAPAALLVTGAAGFGKTALLEHMAALARTRGLATVWIDATDFDSLDALSDALHRSGDPQPGGDGFGAATAGPVSGAREVAAGGSGEAAGHRLWFVDALRGDLVPGLFERLFPALPADVRLVVASPDAPSGWPSDAVLRRLVRTLPLGPLGDDDARALLRLRGAPEGALDVLVGFAYGHPLALALAADTAALAPDVPFAPLDSPALVADLAARFARNTPETARDAVTALALVRTLDEPLLAALLDRPGDAHERFAWLRRLALTQAHGGGLALHPLVQDVLAQDARWRDAARYETLHARACAAYADRLARADRDAFAPLLADYLFLLRENPLVRPFYDRLVRPLRAGTGQRWRERPATPADTDGLVALVERHEGAESAAWARHWLGRDAGTARVYEDAEAAPGTVAGFVLPLALAAGADTGGDPAAEAALRLAESRRALQPHEHVALFRFWMADGSYQALSPVQALIFVETVRVYLSAPGLALSLLPMAEPEMWAMVMAVAGLDRIDGADFEVGGRRYGVYGHDWRAVPPAAWLDRIARFGLRPAPPPRLEPRHLLTRPAFGEAVEGALKCARRPDLLARSVLAGTRLVDGAPSTDRGEAVLAVLRRGIDALHAVPRTRPLASALDASFFSDLPTQERVAEHLGVPFSTYRRHRGRAVAALTDLLWEQEGGDPAASPA